MDTRLWNVQRAVVALQVELLEIRDSPDIANVSFAITDSIIEELHKRVRELKITHANRFRKVQQGPEIRA